MPWLKSRLGWFALNIYLILFGLFFTWSANYYNLPVTGYAKNLGLLLDHALLLREQRAPQKALAAYFSICPMVDPPLRNPGAWQKLGFPVTQVFPCRLQEKNFIFLVMSADGYSALGGYIPGDKSRRIYMLCSPYSCPFGWFGEILTAGNISGWGGSEVVWALHGGAGPYYFRPHISQWSENEFRLSWKLHRPLFYGRFKFIKPGLFMLEESRPEAGIFRESTLARHLKVNSYYCRDKSTWRKFRETPVQDGYYCLNRFIMALAAKKYNEAGDLIEKDFFLDEGAAKLYKHEALRELAAGWDEQTIFEEINPSMFNVSSRSPLDIYFSAKNKGKSVSFYHCRTTSKNPSRLVFIKKFLQKK